MRNVEPTVATRQTLSDMLRVEGGAEAVLFLLRREALQTMLRDNPEWITPQDPWAPTVWNNPTTIIPVWGRQRTTRLPTVFAPGRAPVTVA